MLENVWSVTRARTRQRNYSTTLSGFCGSHGAERDGRHDPVTSFVCRLNQEVARSWSMIRKSMPSDLIRGWVPVFPRDKREAFARRPCSNKKIERDDDSKKSHPDLEAGRQRRCPIWVIRDRLEPAASPAISAVPPKAEVNSELHRLPDDILSAVGGHLHASPIFFRTLSNPVSWNVASWLGPRPSNTLIFSRAPSGSDRRSSVASSL